mgnify:CR=1 FL=1
MIDHPPHVKPPACDGCPHARTGKGYVPGAGPHDAAILAIFERPGKYEVEEGAPLVGKTGKIVERGLGGWHGVRRSNVRLCLAYDDTPAEGRRAAAYCAVAYLRNESEASGARVLLLGGADAVRAFFGGDPEMAKLHGSVWSRAEVIAIAGVNGDALAALPPHVEQIVVSYHPAFAMRGMPQAMPEIEQAIGRARAAADGRLQRETFRIDYTPTPADVRAYLNSAPSSHAIAIDIETPRDRPHSISLIGVSATWGEALVMPGEPEFIDVIGEVLASPRVKVGHNFAFDLRAFMRNGCRVAPPIRDTMQREALLHPPTAEAKKRRWLSLARCALRRFVLPYWKEAESDATRALYRAWRPDVPEWAFGRFYCGVDASTTFMLHARQEEELERAGMLRLANDIVSGAAFVLVEAEDYGMPLDAAARDRRLGETRTKQSGLEQFVCEFTHARHTARLVRVQAVLVELTEQRAAITDKRSDERKALTKRVALARTRLKQIGEEFEATNDNHWRWLLFGGAESGGLALRPTRLTGKSGAAGVDKKDIAELQALYPDVPVLSARVELKHLDKKATWLAALQPEADGRVHFGYTLHRTPNGQVASGGADDEEGKENEGEGNAQNIPEEDRSVFVAEPGMVWCEADYSQIDLRCMAWLACDLDLLAALRDGVNVHAENAAVIFGCAPAETKAKIVRVGGGDKSAYSASKIATHGWDFGMGDVKGGRTFRPCETWPLADVLVLLDDVSRRTGGNEGVSRASYERRRRAAERSTHPEAENAKLARRLYDAANTFKVREWRIAYFRRWKGLARFQQEVVERAERSRELVNPFGRVLPFHGFCWDFKEKRWVFMEREAALAFLPASSRNDIVKAVMPAVAALARKHDGALLTMTHDSLSAQVRREVVDDYARAVKKKMEREWPQMGAIEGFGLFSCPVTVKVGQNWAPASESNKEGLREWRAA